jgi:hypothetical protein
MLRAVGRIEYETAQACQTFIHKCNCRVDMGVLKSIAWVSGMSDDQFRAVLDRPVRASIQGGSEDRLGAEVIQSPIIMEKLPEIFLLGLLGLVPQQIINTRTATIEALAPPGSYHLPHFIRSQITEEDEEDLLE